MVHYACMAPPPVAFLFHVSLSLEVCWLVLLFFGLEACCLLVFAFPCCWCFPLFAFPWPCVFAVCFPCSLCLEPPDPTRTLFASPTNPSPSSQVHFFSGSGYLIKNETVFCNSELFCYKSKTDWDILNGF